VPKVTGREKAQGRLDGIAGEQAIKRVGQALYWGAQQIQAEAQHLITEGSVSGKNHVPSLPGEPPNNDTGVLKSHIEAVQTAPLRAEAARGGHVEDGGAPVHGASDAQQARGDRRQGRGSR
jgi:hypothetical protein